MREVREVAAGENGMAAVVAADQVSVSLGHHSSSNCPLSESFTLGGGILYCEAG